MLGNIAYGVTELGAAVGESTCMAYAWDLETNVRAEKTLRSFMRGRLAGESRN